MIFLCVTGQLKQLDFPRRYIDNGQVHPQSVMSGMRAFPRIPLKTIGDSLFLIARNYLGHPRLIDKATGFNFYCPEASLSLTYNIDFTEGRINISFKNFPSS